MKLRSPYEMLEGCYHLPRFIDKTRLHLAGTLPADYVMPFCHPKGLDGAFLAHFDIPKEIFVQAVAERPSDSEMGVWFRSSVAEFEARRSSWASLAPRLGLPGLPMHDVFRWAMKNVYARCNDPACDTLFKVIDWDEGRFADL